MDVVDIFNEKYVHISGNELGLNDIQIFAKKRGNYIFRVSVVPAVFREDEENVYDMPFIRYMILEIEKDDDGSVVKDYMFFDLVLSDDIQMESLKQRFIDEVESNLVEIFMQREGVGKNDESKSESENFGYI